VPARRREELGRLAVKIDRTVAAVVRIIDSTEIL
jgi:hypothetical protein